MNLKREPAFRYTQFMHRTKLLIIVIGAFLSGLAYAQDEILSEDEAAAKKLVIVEPLNVMSTETNGEYQLVSHRERRDKWGGTLSLVYSMFEPTYYEPNFYAGNFEDIYTSPELPMIELVIERKRNYSFGSVGVQFAVSGYQNDSDSPDLVDSSLQLIPVRLGVTLAFDNITPEAQIVPYFSAGAYTVFYSEELTGNSYNGNTQPAPYVHGGLAMSLDWIDRRASRIAYEDSGIEANYVFIEGRKQMGSSDTSDPDFESDIYVAGGIRVEY